MVVVVVVDEVSVMVETTVVVEVDVVEVKTVDVVLRMFSTGKHRVCDDVPEYIGNGSIGLICHRCTDDGHSRGHWTWGDCLDRCGVLVGNRILRYLL